MEGPEVAKQSTRRRWPGPWRLAVIVSVGGTLAFGALEVHSRRALGRTSLPALGRIPSFEMSDQRGARVSDETLRGQVLVVDFFFASCTTSCPLLTARMASVEKALGDHEQAEGRRLPVHLVSITLDPENDTPEVLGQYAARYGADAERWSFLSGRSADLDRVVVRGFKTAFQRTDGADGISSIMHGEWFVLVDREGVIRGYYAARDPERMAGLVQDVVAFAAGAT